MIHSCFRSSTRCKMQRWSLCVVSLCVSYGPWLPYNGTNLTICMEYDLLKWFPSFPVFPPWGNNTTHYQKRSVTRQWSKALAMKPGTQCKNSLLALSFTSRIITVAEKEGLQNWMREKGGGKRKNRRNPTKEKSLYITGNSHSLFAFL